MMRIITIIKILINNNAQFCIIIKINTYMINVQNDIMVGRY